MYKTKILVVSCLAVVFVSALVFGVFINETWAGYGSSSGIDPVGSPMYSVPVLYAQGPWGLLGFFQGNMSGLELGSDIIAMVWAYSHHQNQNQCITGFSLEASSYKPKYVARCWNGSTWSTTAGDGGHNWTTTVQKIRIINVITNDINGLSDVSLNNS